MLITYIIIQLHSIIMHHNYKDHNIKVELMTVKDSIECNSMNFNLYYYYHKASLETIFKAIKSTYLHLYKHYYYYFRPKYKQSIMFC
jgi:hypothetical protein